MFGIKRKRFLSGKLVAGGRTVAKPVTYVFLLHTLTYPVRNVTFILAIIVRYLFHIILSVLLYGREELPVTLREEDRLRLSEKSLLRSTLRHTRKKHVTSENYMLGNFTNCILSPDTVRV